MLVALLLLFGASVTPAAEPTLDGNWILVYSPSPALEFTDCVLRLVEKDGRLTGQLLEAVPFRGAAALGDVRRDGDLVRLVLKGAAGDQTFEGRFLPSENNVIRGSYGPAQRPQLARLTRTDRDDLPEGASFLARRALPGPLQKAATLTTRVNSLRLQEEFATDAAACAKLTEQVATAEQALRDATLVLFEEMLSKHTDSAGLFETVVNLMRFADPREASPERLAAWARSLVRAAEPYGPRWQREWTLQVAEVLATRPGSGAVALEYARQAEKQLTADQPAEVHARVLKALAAAYRRAGQAAEARATVVRLARFEEMLDRDYDAAFPSLKVPALDGGAKGSRTVVLEHFTGIPCNNCATYYPAFDALLASYSPSDLIYLQYHVHYVGPDPLANLDTEARWNYYATAFPKEVRGTPAILFDGKPQVPGGHMSHMKKRDELLKEARRTFNLYSETIDRHRETPPTAKVAAQVERQGDRLAIKVNVSNLTAVATTKLHVLLVEDTVRHVGSNNQRFHRCVVRAMPLGAGGVALKQRDSTHTADVSLEKLGDGLYRYLDDYGLRRRPWLRPHDPILLHELRVVAFVQEDTTREILHACQVKVAE